MAPKASRLFGARRACPHSRRQLPHLATGGHLPRLLCRHPWHRRGAAVVTDPSFRRRPGCTFQGAAGARVRQRRRTDAGLGRRSSLLVNRDSLLSSGASADRGASLRSRSRQHRPPRGPHPRRARLRPDDQLEDLARLPRTRGREASGCAHRWAASQPRALRIAAHHRREPGRASTTSGRQVTAGVRNETPPKSVNPPSSQRRGRSPDPSRTEAAVPARDARWMIKNRDSYN